MMLMWLYEKVSFNRKSEYLNNFFQITCLSCPSLDRKLFSVRLKFHLSGVIYKHNLTIITAAQ